jgi:hypothetical protein
MLRPQVNVYELEIGDVALISVDGECEFSFVAQHGSTGLLIAGRLQSCELNLEISSESELQQLWWVFDLGSDPYFDTSEFKVFDLVKQSGPLQFGQLSEVDCDDDEMYPSTGRAWKKSDKSIRARLRESGFFNDENAGLLELMNTLRENNYHLSKQSYFAHHSACSTSLF